MSRRLSSTSIAGELYALDTASTNGCYLGDDYQDPFTLRKVEAEVPIFLGTVARVRWRWAN